MEHAGAEIDDLIFDRVSAFENAGSRHLQPTINRRRPGGQFLQSPRGRLLMALRDILHRRAISVANKA
jgi:hypothetical protein